MNLEKEVAVVEQVETEPTDYTITQDGTVVETEVYKENPDSFQSVA